MIVSVRKNEKERDMPNRELGRFDRPQGKTEEGEKRDKYWDLARELKNYGT